MSERHSRRENSSPPEPCYQVLDKIPSLLLHQDAHRHVGRRQPDSNTPRSRTTPQTHQLNRVLGLCLPQCSNAFHLRISSVGVQDNVINDARILLLAVTKGEV